MKGLEYDNQSRWYSLDRPDVVFIAFTIVVLILVPRFGIVDDPGLGWHLRTADLMWEKGGFVYQEEFCYPTEGKPWVTRAWLGDILFRLAYAWGGLNGIAVFTIMTMALALRCLYVRMLRDGIPGLVAGGWIAVAFLGTAQSWVARPNIFTFVGLVLVARICEEFHAGKIGFAKTLWLLPIFLFWVNLHGGFLAGLLVLGITLFVECVCSLFGNSRELRGAARQRLGQLAVVSTLVFGVTLINPNGIGLHLWNYGVLTDPYVQTETTTEWWPPDFSSPLSLIFEILILLLLALALVSRRRLGLLAVLLNVIWLHFALGGARYTELWAVIAVPAMAVLSCHIPWLRGLVLRLTDKLSQETQRSLLDTPDKSPILVSLVFAVALMFASRWMGNYTQHQPDSIIATEALDRLLENYAGERVFHDANWGGYLTWHGWDLEPRFRTCMDDRSDVHGREQTENYFAIMRAAPGWKERLDRLQVDLLCIRSKSPLAAEVEKTDEWLELSCYGETVVFRRSPSVR